MTPEKEPIMIQAMTPMNISRFRMRPGAEIYTTPYEMRMAGIRTLPRLQRYNA